MSLFIRGYICVTKRKSLDCTLGVKTDFSLVWALDVDKVEVERTAGANFFGLLDLWLQWERDVNAAAAAAEPPQRNTRGNSGNGGDGDGVSGIHNYVVLHLFLLLHIKFHISPF